MVLHSWKNVAVSSYGFPAPPISEVGLRALWKASGMALSESENEKTCRVEAISQQRVGFSELQWWCFLRISDILLFLVSIPLIQRVLYVDTCCWNCVGLDFLEEMLYQFVEMFLHTHRLRLHYSLHAFWSSTTCCPRRPISSLGLITHDSSLLSSTSSWAFWRPSFWRQKS